MLLRLATLCAFSSLARAAFFVCLLLSFGNLACVCVCVVDSVFFEMCKRTCLILGGVWTIAADKDGGNEKATICLFPFGTNNSLYLQFRLLGVFRSSLAFITSSSQKYLRYCYLHLKCCRSRVQIFQYGRSPVWYCTRSSFQINLHFLGIQPSLRRPKRIFCFLRYTVVLQPDSSTVPHNIGSSLFYKETPYYCFLVRLV